MFLTFSKIEKIRPKISVEHSCPVFMAVFLSYLQDLGADGTCLIVPIWWLLFLRRRWGHKIDCR